MKIEPTKNHSVHLRLNDEQFQFLLNLAKTLDVGVSDVVRMLVNSTLYVTKKAEDIGEELGGDLVKDGVGESLEDTAKQVLQNEMKKAKTVDTLEGPSANNTNIIEHKL